MKPLHDKETHDKIRQMAETSFGKHRIEKEPTGWLCKNPEAGFYWFRVILAPNLILVTGDVGDLLIHPGVTDPMRWLKKCLRDPSYVFGKTDGSLKVYDPELMARQMQELQAQLLEGLDPENPDDKERIDKINYTIEELVDTDYFSAEAFVHAVYNSDLEIDSDTIPTVERYSEGFYWRLEALRWFVGHVDA